MFFFLFFFVDHSVEGGGVKVANLITPQVISPALPSGRKLDGLGVFACRLHLTGYGKVVHP